MGRVQYCWPDDCVFKLPCRRQKYLINTARSEPPRPVSMKFLSKDEAYDSLISIPNSDCSIHQTTVS